MPKHDAPSTEPEWFTAEELAARLKTTRRTILRWVAEKRIPSPQKFGKLARWSAAVVANIDAKGITGQPVPRAEFNQLPPAGMKITCPCCETELLVKRDGTAQVADATEEKDNATEEKEDRAAPASTTRKGKKK